jgi:hypothetical protein
MTLKRVWMAFLLGAAVTACEKSTSGVLQTPPPLAGLRYFDAVPDTGYMDFRIVDIVAYAPNAVRAIFRTGGNPLGVATTLPPPYLPVQAGTRHITVFLDSLDLATASNVMYDTTVTFTEKHNYTFILYGSARGGRTKLHSLVLDDTTQTPDTNSTVWVRTLNLAGSNGENGDTLGLGVPDVFVSTTAPASPATFTAPAFHTPTAYTRVGIGALLAQLTRTTLTTPVTVSAALPAGIVGTTTVNPVAGALAKGTGISVLILPRVIPDSITSLTNVATVVTPALPALPFTVDTMFATTALPHHLTTGNAIHITGATPAAYNGTWTVTVITATTIKWAYAPSPMVVPATPATGTIVYRNSWKDYANPGMVFLIDKQPSLTAP